VALRLENVLSITVYESNAGLLGLWSTFKYVVIESKGVSLTITNLLVHEDILFEFFHRKEILRKKQLFPYPKGKSIRNE
jgi:hypothetical protein